MSRFTRMLVLFQVLTVSVLVACGPEQSMPIDAGAGGGSGSGGGSIGMGGGAAGGGSTGGGTGGGSTGGGTGGGSTGGGMGGGSTGGGTGGGSAMENCACQTASLCSERSGSATACVALQANCSGTFLSACPVTGVVHRCDGNGRSTLYYSVAKIASRKASCDSAGGTFSVVSPPSPTGSPCSCQRNSEVCVGAWGSVCSSLSCSTVLVSSECSPGAIAGSCVKDDGQVAIAFYSPMNASSAEDACLMQTGYRWVP